METKLPLSDLGRFVRNKRKTMKMNQVDFYRYLFPEKELEDENIKKKMHAIENGKGKEMNYDLLFRLHEIFDLSFDYLFGFDTEYPNYENKAACKYTGLSPASIKQLHFWSEYLSKDEPTISQCATDEERDNYFKELSRVKEVKWIFAILNILLQPKSIEEENSCISDLSILYDIYMLVTDKTRKIRGLPIDVVNSSASWQDKALQSVWLSPDNLYFSDSMNEIHHVNIREVNKKIWEERLLRDIDTMTQYFESNKNK